MEELIEPLLAANADTEARNADGKTPADLASENGWTELAEILREP